MAINNLQESPLRRPAKSRFTADDVAIRKFFPGATYGAENCLSMQHLE
jgi:hypothetical protein